jgi:D-tagatose-1,6-bisphosphate aldolase subunit GatZ/KbaZ
VGTDVPAPGGMMESTGGRHITDSGQAAQTLTTLREAFEHAGLMAAWGRVAAMVVDPGVEFGGDEILRYEPNAAAALVAFIRQQPDLVFEAHSTDYQTAEDLKAMVHDQFAILKVGPALTFAFREAVFGLADIEAASLPGEGTTELSGLLDAIDLAMTKDPLHWRDYYHGDNDRTAFARKFSRLDRIRYYWQAPAVEQALKRLMDNLEHCPPPLSLLSEHLPSQFKKVSHGQLPNRPRDLIRDHIQEVLQDYQRACA